MFSLCICSACFILSDILPFVLFADSFCLATESARESSPSKVVHNLHAEGKGQGGFPTPFGPYYEIQAVSTTPLMACGWGCGANPLTQAAQSTHLYRGRCVDCLELTVTYCVGRLSGISRRWCLAGRSSCATSWTTKTARWVCHQLFHSTYGEGSC